MLEAPAGTASAIPVVDLSAGEAACAAAVDKVGGTVGGVRKQGAQLGDAGWRGWGTRRCGEKLRGAYPADT
ncbi:unnamed protein product, partial [Closterium sp. NIES-64]